MSFRSEKRTEALGAPTPSELKDRNRRKQEQYERARQQFAVARAVATHPGSLRQKRGFVKTAMEGRLLAPGEPPSVETIRRLETKWNSGAQSIDDYLEAPRAGRPRKHLPTVIEQEIRKRVKEGRVDNIRQLTFDLQEIAREHGVPIPTYEQVHRRVGAVARAVRAASRHGSRAGEIDGMPHARVVSRNTHDTWALDELTVPVYVKLYHWLLAKWVSALVDVVLIVDVCSTAVVGYYVVDPTRRIDEQGSPFLSGFDSEDVMAALLSAASPELAPDATREFAGYLPDRIRWDNAKAHKAIRARLEESGIKICPIRLRRAASNAAVERRVGILKGHCRGIRGHRDEYMPTDRVKFESVDLALQRTVMAGYTSEREPRRIPINPDQLLDLEEFRLEFDRVVRRYNYEMRNRMHGLTPAAKYHRDKKARRPRRGLDLVRSLEPQTKLVTRDGILHHQDGLAYRFYPMYSGVMVMLDNAVTYHPDPLMRGIFIQDGDRRLKFIPPQDTQCDEEAAVIAKNQSFICRLISDTAQKAREESMRRQLGEEAVAAAQAEYQAQVQQLKQNTRAAEAKPIENELAGPASPASDLISIDPWLTDDPSAFIRPAQGNLEENA